MCEYEALQHRELLQGKEILKYITRVQLLGAENAELKVELQEKQKSMFRLETDK